MAQNVEIKAALRDYEVTRHRALELGGGDITTLQQRDVFFAVARGRLKLRVFAEGHGELIAYERANRDGPKISTYHIAAVPDPMAMEAALGAALGVRAVVVKTRELVMIGRTRVHLDRVEDLGEFLELEVVMADGEETSVGDREAQDLMSALNVAPSDLIECAYVDLIDRSKT